MHSGVAQPKRSSGPGSWRSGDTGQARVRAGASGSAIRAQPRGRHQSEEDHDQRQATAEESDAGWNKAFVSAIREFKERFRGSPDLGPALAIASEDLYGRDIHWALELIQNAEDAGARHVTFIFERERVVVTNDGDVFTAEDVWGICSAGHIPRRTRSGSSVDRYAVTVDEAFRLLQEIGPSTASMVSFLVRAIPTDDASEPRRH
jgi:hypothetical protein